MEMIAFEKLAFLLRSLYNFCYHSLMLASMNVCVFKTFEEQVKLLSEIGCMQRRKLQPIFESYLLIAI